MLPENPFSLTLIILGIITIFTSVPIFRNRENTVRSFGYVMLAIAIWAFCYGIELSNDRLKEMLFWIRLEYIGIALLPSFWAVFVIKFIGKYNWLNLPNLVLIFVFGIITIILVWTNQYHYLHYADVSVDKSTGLPLLNITTGIWYKIFTVYFYLMLAGGIVLLITRFRTADPIYKKQNKIIIIGALVPWFVNLVYLLGFRPYGHIDLTPYAFIATVLIISFGILRFQLFDVVPVAREKVLEVMKDGMLVLDNKNRVVDLNTEMRSFIPFAKEKFVGEEINILFQNQPLLTQMVEKRNHDKLEIQTEDNNPRFFEVNLTPLFDKNTVYSGVILLFREVTEKKHDEQKLKEQAEELMALNRLKDKLFTVLSHDLHAPFKNLTDLLNMTQEGDVTDDDIKGLLPYVMKYTNNINSLLENLLHWSRSQLQGEVIKKETFDLKELTIEVINLYEKKAIEKGISLSDHIQSQTLVFADKNMIKLVLRNLMANAVKFCKHDDTIAIFSEEEEKHIRISFCDTGVGIAKENQKRIFGLEGFSTAGTNQEKGTGIGLLLCKEFVQKNSGKIWLESELGKGSKFHFTLPKA